MHHTFYAFVILVNDFQVVLISYILTNFVKQPVDHQINNHTEYIILMDCNAYSIAHHREYRA